MKLSVGQRIRRLRDDLGAAHGRRLTQSWLAEAVGVSKSSVAKWETDVQLPGTEYVFRLADVLQTTPAYILKGVAAPGNSYPASGSTAGVVREGNGRAQLGTAEERPEDAVAAAEGGAEETAGAALRVTAEPIGDGERIALLRLLAVVQEAVAAGPSRGSSGVALERVESLLQQLDEFVEGESRRAAGADRRRAAP